MKQYLEALREILDNGVYKEDRTGAGRKSIYGYQMRFKMSDGFPVVTTRQIFTKAMIAETLWFISGSNDISVLKELGASFWDRWAVKEKDIEAFVIKYRDKLHIQDSITNETRLATDDELDIIKQQFRVKYLGKIGNIYGPSWRNAPGPNEYHPLWPKISLDDIPNDKLFEYNLSLQQYIEQTGNHVSIEEWANFNYRSSVDQLNELIINLRDRPYSSRHYVSAWIPSQIPFEDLSPQENVMLDKGALSPCHRSWHCFVKPPKEEGGKKQLSLLVYMGSNDVAVGCPVNIAQYALMLHLLAHVTDMEVDELIYNTGDLHLYNSNHIELAKEQITRDPLPLPKLWLNPDVKSIYDFTPDDIKIIDYKHHPKLDYEVHV